MSKKSGNKPSHQRPPKDRWWFTVGDLRAALSKVPDETAVCIMDGLGCQRVRRVSLHREVDNPEHVFVLYQNRANPS